MNTPTSRIRMFVLTEKAKKRKVIEFEAHELHRSTQSRPMGVLISGECPREVDVEQFRSVMLGVVDDQNCEIAYRDVKGRFFLINSQIALENAWKVYDKMEERVLKVYVITNLTWDSPAEQYLASTGLMQTLDKAIQSLLEHVQNYEQERIPWNREMMIPLKPGESKPVVDPLRDFDPIAFLSQELRER
eukprot:TRINITY_DN504_c1_g1_i1.p1 TRINITY_DN504_c1_g1~~TRINITY_DN504_c1_g1_i1.p1  ORF type:complete len:189 (-),score=62.50 TRINITY_DN504_c1_g1_i1:177-743(-)